MYREFKSKYRIGYYQHICVQKVSGENMCSKFSLKKSNGSLFCPVEAESSAVRDAGDGADADVHDAILK